MLELADVQRRVAQFVEAGLPVLVTTACLLVDKARLLPKSSFVVSAGRPMERRAGADIGQAAGSLQKVGRVDGNDCVHGAVAVELGRASYSLHPLCLRLTCTPADA